MFIQKGIEYGFPIPAEFDKAALFEDAQLMGDSALGHIQKLCQVADAHFMLHQDIQDLDAGGIGKYFESSARLYSCSLGGMDASTALMVSGCAWINSQRGASSFLFMDQDLLLAVS